MCVGHKDLCRFCSLRVCWRTVLYDCWSCSHNCFWYWLRPLKSPLGDWTQDQLVVEQSRLCKHCGWVLNTDYVSQVAQRRLTSMRTRNRKLDLYGLTALPLVHDRLFCCLPLPWTGRPPWLHSQKTFFSWVYFSLLAGPTKYFNKNFSQFTVSTHSQQLQRTNICG